jgi:hypothetical protein
MKTLETILKIIFDRLYDKRFLLTGILWTSFLIFAPNIYKEPILHVSILPPTVGLIIGLIFLFFCSHFISLFVFWLYLHIPHRKYKYRKDGGILWRCEKQTGKIIPLCLTHQKVMDDIYVGRTGWKGFYCRSCGIRGEIVIPQEYYDDILERNKKHFSRYLKE